jgi:hypothetical protein
MSVKIDTRDFFEDKSFEKKVKLTQEEAKVLSDFQCNYEYHNGYQGISGGFAFIILEEFEEEDEDGVIGDFILGHMKSGIQSDCENVVYTDSIVFNRATKVIKFN